MLEGKLLSKVPVCEKCGGVMRIVVREELSAICTMKAEETEPDGPFKLVSLGRTQSGYSTQGPVCGHCFGPLKLEEHVPPPIKLEVTGAEAQNIAPKA